MAEQPDNAAIEDPGPGVHVVVHPNPLRAGRMVAEAIGGVVVDLPMMAEATVAQRVRLPEARANRARLDELEDAALGLAGGNYERDRVLADRWSDLERLARRRVLDRATTDLLHTLTVELASLETAIDGTERALRGEGTAEVEDGAGSPAAIRRAAAAAVRAEAEAVADAEDSLALLDLASADAATPSRPVSDRSGPDDAVEDPDSLELPGSDGALAPQPHHRLGGDGTVLMPLGIFLLIGVFPTALILLGRLPAIAAWIAIGFGTALALVVHVSLRIESRDQHHDGSPLDGTARRSGVEVGAGSDRHRLGETDAVRRARALDDARARSADARRVWEAMAGAGADPWDPSLAGRTGSAGEPDPASTDPDAEASWATRPAAAGLRALLVVHRHLRAEWRVTWAELGRTAPPPDPGLVDLLLADLRETAPDPVEARAALDAVRAAEGRLQRRRVVAEAMDTDELAGLRADAPDDDDLDDRPLVLVMPFAELSSSRRLDLRRMLDEVPDDITIVLAVEASTDVPSIPATA